MTLDMNSTTKRIDEIIDSISDILEHAELTQRLAKESVAEINKSSVDILEKSQALREQIREEISETTQAEIQKSLRSSIQDIDQEFKDIHTEAKEACKRYKDAGKNYEDKADITLRNIFLSSLLASVIGLIVGGLFLWFQIDSLKTQNKALQSLISQISRKNNSKR